VLVYKYICFAYTCNSEEKNSAKFSVISLVAVIAGFIIICVSPEVSYETANAEKDDDLAVETDVYLEENNDLASAKDNGYLEEKNDLASAETDGYLEENDDLAAAETDEYLEENAGGFYIDEYGEAVAVDGIMLEQDYFDDSDYDEMQDYFGNSDYDEISDSAKILNLEDVQKCLFPISEYPYQNTKKAKKLMKTYDAAVKADIEDFVYVEEISEGGIFTDEKLHYKKTVEESKADYRYYGKLNKDNEADGTGILLSMRDDDGFNDYASGSYLAAVYYIGEFDNGYKDGYGIEYNINIKERIFTVKYEGSFKKGNHDGQGAAYDRSLITRDYPDVDKWMYWLVNMGGRQFDGSLERIDGFDKDSAMIDKDTYDYLFPDVNGNGLITYPIIASYISYEGGYKDGIPDGKGAEYSESWNNEQEGTVNYKSYEGKFKNGKYNGQGTSYFANGQIHYKGEYKDGKYNGKGTLYDEQGNVVHKGKFKKGDIE